MTTMSTTARIRSTAGVQRTRIVSAAIEVFSRSGYWATPVADVAAEAGVSTAYVFRLFDGKLGLFIAAVEECYSRVSTALVSGAEASAASDPTARLEAMSVAYIDLISDRSLIALQVHAQSACSVPEIREAVQRGIAVVVRAVARETGADDDAVQRFIAYGQLCHLVVLTGLEDVDASWARLVDHGIRHH